MKTEHKASSSNLSDSFRAIREHPASDAHRLAYAESITKRGGPGDAERAELIRLHTNADPSDATTREHILTLCCEERSKIASYANIYDTHFQGGLLTEACAFSKEIVKGGDALFNEHPALRTLHLAAVDDDLLLELAKKPWLEQIRSLSLYSSRKWDAPEFNAGLNALLTSPHLAQLDTIAFAVIRMRKDILKTLTDSPGLKSLSEISFHAACMRDAEIHQLSEAPWPLRKLHLTSYPFSGTKVTPDGIRELVRSKSFAHLHTVGLSGKPVGPSGVTALAEGPLLEDLESLSLQRTGADDFAIAAVLESEKLPKLRELWIDEERIAAVARQPGLQRIRTLHVSEDVDLRTLDPIVQSPYFSPDCRIDVWNFKKEKLSPPFFCRKDEEEKEHPANPKNNARVYGDTIRIS